MGGVKYALLALSALGVVLSLVYNVLSMGPHGIAVFVLCVIPTALAALSIKQGGMPRWASGVSMGSLFIVAAKTSGDDTSTNNIMVVAFFAMLCALLLLIVPDRPKDPALPSSGAD